MSDYESYKGNLKKINLTKLDIFNEWIKNNKLPSYYNMPNDIDEWFDDELGFKYTSFNNDVFEIVNLHELNNEKDIFDMTNTDSGFSFHLKYYNGGCSFSEALQTAFDNKH
jgi:hypothetical protein